MPAPQVQQVAPEDVMSRAEGAKDAVLLTAGQADLPSKGTHGEAKKVTTDSIMARVSGAGGGLSLTA